MSFKFNLSLLLGLLLFCAQSQTIYADTETSPDITGISQPLVRAVFQRNFQNTAMVPIQGTYTGTATRIEARALVMDGFSGTDVDWQVIDDSPSGNSFSSFLTVPAGGWYRVEIIAYNSQNASPVFGKNGFAVGEVFITAGQSNSANCGSPPYTPVHSTASAWTGTSWRHAYDPQPIASCSGGSPWSRLADILIDELGVPVGFISVGVGGTRVDQWVPSANDLYPRIQEAITAVGPNGMRAILWHQGESDAVRPPTTDPLTYAARLRQVIDQSRVDAGFHVPWGIALVSFMPESYAQVEQWREGVRNGQQLVIQDDPYNFLGPDTDIWTGTEYRYDTIHFNAAGLQLHAEAWMPTIKKIINPWDSNLDNTTNLLDLSDFASYWLENRYWLENNDKLAAHWQMDESDGISAADSSANDHIATLINGPQWNSGMFGNALSFDGIDDYVEAHSYQGISGSDARTVSAWIKTSSYGKVQGIVSWGTPFENGKYWALTVNADGSLGCSVWGSVINSITTVNDGNWHNVAVSWPGGSNVTIDSVCLFIDGVKAGITIAQNNAESISTALAGKVHIGGMPEINNNLFFNGIIDDVKIFDSAISAASHATNHDPVWTSENFGGPISFNGTDDYIEDESFLGIAGSDARTVSAWIKTSSSGSGQGIISWGTALENGKYWALLLGGDGRLGCSVWGSTIYSYITVNDGFWHNIVVSWPGGSDNGIDTVIIYIDGVKANFSFGQGMAETISTVLDIPIHIGGMPEVNNNLFFNGMINDVRIYDSALSLTEISPICDFDHNGIVNIADFSVLAAHWLE